jgi:hypothetical protein
LLKDLRRRFNGGSGFQAAICTVDVKTIRGWEAAPTIHKLINLINFKIDIVPIFLSDVAIHYKVIFLGFRKAVRARPVKLTPAHIKNANR